MKNKYGFLHIAFVLSLLLPLAFMQAQTPGMIFENPGIEVLDPNGDGYISRSTLGFSEADRFSNQQSEIPYVPFAVVMMEPTQDPGSGPNCFFNDFDDIRDYGEPMYTYFDRNTTGGPYLLYRFRLSGYAPNSKSYSVFIDIDGKFGDPAIVGASAGDPNYIPENPGFEVEIYMASNFGVGIYNIDGVHSGNSTDPANVNAGDGTYPYSSHAHKAVAWTYTGGTCSDGTEYFYDFYIPWSAVTGLTFTGETEISLGSQHINSSTPMRMVGATIMNPNPGFNKGINNASLSDWGGIDGNGTPEELVTQLVNVFPPTNAGQIDNNQRISPRSDCPTLNTPKNGAVSIAGTSTEDDGTIITGYYSADGNSYSAFSNTGTVANGSWVIDVSPEYPSGLTAGHYIKATARNLNETYGTTSITESESFDDCDIEQVSMLCTNNLTDPVRSISPTSGGKGFGGTLQAELGTDIEVYLYTADGTLVSTDPAKGTGNPVLVTGLGIGTDVSWIIGNGTGQSFPEGNYYVVTVDITRHKCESGRTYVCLDNGNKTPYHQSGAATPTLDPPTILSTSLSGSNIDGATVAVFIDGAYYGDASVTGSSWTYSPAEFKGCESISIYQYVVDDGTSDNGQCVSPIPASATIPVIDTDAPAISGTYCEGGDLIVRGTSTAPDGTPVAVYQDGAVLDTAIVNNSEWHLFEQVLIGGSTLTARIPAGSCNNQSALSPGVAVGTPVSNAGVDFISPPLEGETTVTGIAPAGDTVRLYIDGYNDPAWKAASGGGTFTISNLEDLFGNPLIYAGAHLQLSTSIGSGCESALTPDYEVPCDVNLIALNKTLVAESPVCSGNASTITISNSQRGIMYQVYDAGNNPVGFTASGNGGDIYISTGPLAYAGTPPAYDAHDFTIVATRMVPTSTGCSAPLNNGAPVIVDVREDVGPIDLEVVSSPDPATICSGGSIDLQIIGSQSSIFYQLFNDETGDSLSSKFAGNGTDITISSNPINGAGNVPVRVTASSGSCTADLSTVVGVLLKESPGITGNLVVCKGVTGEMYTTEPGMTNYTWSVTGGTITAGQNTDAVIVTWNAAGTQTISVDYDESICGTSYEVDVEICTLPDVSLSSDVNSLDENGGIATLTATLSSLSSSNVIVSLGFTGTATGSGTDYTAAANTITIPASSLTGTTTVTAVDDAEIEGDETIIIDITVVTNANENGTQRQSLTLIDDEEVIVPTVTLSSNAATLAENGGTATITATLNTASTSDVSVNLAYSGTATGAGTDYTASQSTITIPAGSLAGTTMLTAVDDVEIEGDETIVVDITSAVNASENGTQQQRLTIIDDEEVVVPLVTLSGDASSLTELGGTITITATLNTISTSDVTVSLGFSGTASGTGTDYSVAASSITIPAGSLSGSTTVTAADDSETEGAETIVVDISGVTNASENGTQQLTFTITDDEYLGEFTVSLSADLTTLAEAGAMATITATLSTVSASDVTVSLGFTGTATGTGTDYTAGSATITISAGSLTGTTTLTTIDDSETEGDETIVVDISSVTNAIENGTQQLAFTITDDEEASVPKVSLSTGATTLQENGGEATLTATLSVISTSDVIVSLEFTGTATGLGTDYTATATSITIPAGSLTGTTTVTAIDDAEMEGDETIVIDITAVTNAIENGTQQQSVTITDDEEVIVPKVTLSSDTTRLAEGGGVALLTASLSITSTSDVVVSLGYSGTATGNGTDYTAASETITIPAGSLTGTTTLTAVDDAETEGGETIVVDIIAVTNASENGTQQQTLTITDNESTIIPSVTLSSDVGMLAENGGVATLTLTLSSATTKDVTVILVFAGTAGGDGSDFTFSATIITIPAGSLTGTIRVTANDDNEIEGSESIIVVIAGVTNAIEEGSQMQTLVISDDDYNSAPLLFPDADTVLQDVTLNGDFLANDTNPEEDGMFVNTTPVAGPSNGTIILYPDGTYSYTPDAGFTGTDMIEYEVCDLADPPACATATITITVLPVPDDKDGDGIPNDQEGRDDPDQDGLPNDEDTDSNNNGVPDAEEPEGDCDNDGTENRYDMDPCEQSLFIPEGFSPNGDGANDYFEIPGLEGYGVVSIRVFNRWGTVVYRVDQYMNDWDGTSNVNLSLGTELPTGTYFYQVTIEETREILSGYIYLNR